MGPKRRLYRLGLGKPTVKQAVDWEIEHYLAEQTDRLVDEGMDPAQARREAERRFGDVARQRRKIMAVDGRRVAMRKRGETWDAVITGLRQTYAGVRRAPGFALAVVLTLSLGIGVNAAMFGIVDRLLLSPPEQISEPDGVRRVLREGRFFGENDILPVATYPDVEDLRTVPEFASVGAVSSPRRLVMGVGEGARQVRASLATHDFFPTLGTQAHLGRLFTPGDDEIGAPGTAVLGYEFWEASFGADPDVLGRTVELSGLQATVIGVMPKGFTGLGLAPVDVWLPAVWGQHASTGSDRFLTSRGYWWLRAVVRITDEAAIEAGEARATALHVNSREELVAQGRFDGNARILTAPVIAALGPEASAESRVARWLAGVSLIVLIIACANVANLLLAQGATRRREVAVRLSLGASRGRLLGGMVMETLILAGVGGLIALALAQWSGGLIRAVLIPDVLWTTTSLNGRVLAFTAVTSAVAGLLAGLGPALQSTRADLAEDLAEGGRSHSRGRSRVRGLLTAAQATLSVLLLVGAGLFVRSVVEVRNLDLGFDVDNLVLAQLEFVGEDPEPVEQARLYEEAMAAVAGVQGVAAAAGTDMPFQWASILELSVPGLDSLPVPQGAGPFYYGVTPGYMATLGLEILQGRGIEDTDVEGGPSVAVVNETMARTLWPGQDALGQCFHVDGAEECTTVVGIIENASRGELEGRPHLAYHMPLAQVGNAPAGLYIRTDDSPAELAARVAPVLRSFSPRVRFAQVQTFDELLDPQTRSWTLGAALFTAFGALALIVAAIGLYSLLAFDVAQRTREIGIRVALGAQKARVLRGIVTSGARLAVLGIVLGVAASFALAPFAQEMLFHVDARDPLILASVAVLLMVVAVIASTVPGLRATRVDPTDALRAD